MEQLWAALDGAWRVLAAGLLLGAGLPAIFSFGSRAMAWGTGGDAEIHPDGVVVKPHPFGRVIGYAMFSLVVIAVLLGIGYIVAHGFGVEVTFDGMIPVFSSRH